MVPLVAYAVMITTALAKGDTEYLAALSLALVQLLVFMGYALVFIGIPALCLRVILRAARAHRNRLR
ncbi:MAG: hypothetical protein HOV68_20380 [Streptomycetaceae bacterium]|nr:hypothetical protein [Streptomycetaceae bacterium]